MESRSSAADGGGGASVGQCNGVQTVSSGSLVDVDSLHAEVAALRSELSNKHDLLVKLQDRERQLRERSAIA